MSQSKLQLYSFGVVAENKPMSTTVALIIPVEVFPLLDGELAVEDTELTTTGVDEDEKSYSVKVTSRSAIKCTWLQWGSNRVTAPDIRRGERVAIYRYADSDKFFWVSLGLDDHLRRLETVIYRFSDIPDGVSDEPLSVENCHTLEISAHSKLITLTTAQSNEEPYGYTFQFNLKEGCVTLADTDDNYFEFDSAETKLTLFNKDGTFVSLDKKDLKCNAPQDFLYTVERDFITKVGNNFILEVGNDISITAGNNFTADISGDVSYSCSKWLTQANKFTVDAPDSEFTGNLKVGGALEAVGGITGQGTLGISGTSTFGGAMTANGITSSATIKGPKGSI